jgi:hypothetical protein
VAIRIRNAVLMLAIFAGLVSNPPDLSSCTSGIPAAAFTFWNMPEDAAGRFARGQLGILQPAFPRFYLIVAYRHLAGIGLNAEERTALFGPQSASESPWSAQPSDAVQKWQKTRALVAGFEAPPRIATFKTISGNNYYVGYLNCGDNAFLNAAKTLEDRGRQLGLNSPAVKDWIAAQDQVFANCSGGPSIPVSLPGAATRLMRADREYQIAAAHFYAGHNDIAKPMFLAIAKDRSSPWSGIAPYLVARSLIREATLGVNGPGIDREKLTAAEAQLQSILHDVSRPALHPAAERLLAYVGLRLYPVRRMHELALALLRKDSQATMQQNVIDYRFLYDQFEKGNFGGIEALPSSDDLTAWILAFQSRDADAAGKAVSAWRAKPTAPWLVLALSKAGPDDPAASELIAAARQVRRDSPAYATIAFHAIRLLVESKRTGEAREWLDKLLAGDRTATLTSSLNLFRAERMRVAATWDEFLTYALRTPVGTAYEFVQYTGNARPDAEDEGFSPPAKSRPGFDVDATRILNEQTPLSLWLDAARRETLPRPVRREVAVAGWVRAALLGDGKTARQLMPALEDLAPELKQLLHAYADAPDSRARAFAAVFLMLRTPGMRPYVQVAFGRSAPLEKVDEFRDNWWCSTALVSNRLVPDYYRQASVLNDPLRLLYTNGAPLEQFLPADERARGQNEWLQLSKMPAAPEYLAGLTIDWVKSAPGDPRAPEALHLAVRATRYGCVTEKSRFSKEAFELLRRRYPNSEWARKTKFWF